MPIKKHNPATIHPPSIYSHLVTVTGGKLLVLAGQVAWDIDGNVVGENDFRAQVDQALKNIQAILASQNADFSNVVKFTTYIVDMNAEKRSVMRDVFSQYVKLDKPPAHTLLGVQSLAIPELMIEIDVLAAVDDE